MADSTIIAPAGELDVSRIDELRRLLSEAEGEAAPRLVVDLSEVSFIDSTGLGALVDLHHRLRRGERRLSVVAPGGTAAALLLNLAGLRGRMPIYESRRDALGEAAGPAVSSGAAESPGPEELRGSPSPGSSGSPD